MPTKRAPQGRYGEKTTTKMTGGVPTPCPHQAGSVEIDNTFRIETDPCVESQAR